MRLRSFIAYLFIFVIILVLLNIFLLSDLINSRIRGRNDYNNLDFNYKVNEESFLSIHDLPEDISGEYYVHRNFIRPKNTPLSKDIVLATHCTGDHLHHLVSFTEIWQGPISVAVFVPGNSLENTLSILYILYGCYTRLRHQISIHLVHPIPSLLKESDLMFLITKSQEIHVKCSKALETITNINNNADKNYDRKIEYPNNLLRNTAKHGVTSQYALVIDVDMKPNENLYRDFVKFARKNNLFGGGNSFYNDKSLFVLPAFEINAKQVDKMPKDKSQLIGLLDNGAVRPFYSDVCWKCQRPTNYEKWRSLDKAGDGMDVGYESKWQDPWEPFFISPRSAPDYDERFRQYGFNRISHACELHIAGYRYFILDQGFLLHQGFKDRTSFHKTKNDENNRNRILFRNFKTELKDKYPNSVNRC